MSNILAVSLSPKLSLVIDSLAEQRGVTPGEFVADILEAGLSDFTVISKAHTRAARDAVRVDMDRRLSGLLKKRSFLQRFSR